jgi:pimeloyl-ACP methyl ester carboxylesterase
MTEGTARIESGRLWFERAGEGFPVVLIHPGLWDARIWDDQFEEFSRHHDIIRYDARGYGRSDFPDAPYSDLRDLRYLLGELDIRRCALVGCATGAQLAIDFALAYPDVADAIVVVSPGLTGYRWHDAGLQTLVDEVDRAVREGDMARAIDVELAVWAPTSAATDPRVRQIALDNARVLRMDDSLMEVPPSAVARLGDVQAATLVVVGHLDLAEIHAIADVLVAQIPGASKRLVAEADQLVNVSKAEKFNRLVLDFLSFRA